MEQAVVKKIIGAPVPISEWFACKGNTQWKLAKALNVAQSSVWAWQTRDIYILETQDNLSAFEIKQLGKPGNSP
jgi:hypothetical protein